MRHETWDWAETLASWADVLQEEVDDFNESLTLADVCEWAAQSDTIEKLQGRLRDGTDPLAWLNQLYALVGATDCLDLLETEAIVPSQSGVLKKITDLSLDRGIDGELKEIAESLGFAVRSTLVHPDVKLEELIEFDELAESDALSDVLQRFKEKAKALEAMTTPERQLASRPRLTMRATAAASSDQKSGDDVRRAFQSIAVRLFVWLVRHDHKDKLDGFPAVNRVRWSSFYFSRTMSWMWSPTRLSR
jgi:hypothetical protein